MTIEQVVRAAILGGGLFLALPQSAHAQASTTEEQPRYMRKTGGADEVIRGDAEKSDQPRYNRKAGGADEVIQGGTGSSDQPRYNRKAGGADEPLDRGT